MSVETIVWCERCGKPLDQANENPVQVQVWATGMNGTQLHFHASCWTGVRDFATAGRPLPLPPPPAPPAPEPEPDGTPHVTQSIEGVSI